ncbi:hypothetical protein Csa_001336 [Cucumis sativus]|uniref:Uncharacterized protein n=1 Tax=Cucumis sativus TaxID=3659 RepID=A0A0A0LDK4_CUCSA|nr:hypothetical protein Csa_001336 [Cucumis sativus]
MQRPKTSAALITAVSSSSSSSNSLNFSSMKLFQRIRKMLVRFVFSIPSRVSSSSRRRTSYDKSFDPPKTSCSSYYSSHSHYDEAIADCIEFFNKSSQDRGFEDQKPITNLM